jgi:hypothetical protein
MGEQLTFEPWFKVRYSHGQTDIVPKSLLDKILKSGKNVFEVLPINKKE